MGAEAAATTDAPGFTRRYVDLAQPRLGADVVSASDEFFGARGRLIRPEAPVFIPDKYDDHGKWMDGWESRRRRGGGHDWCVIRICPGRIHGFDIDTRYFTGNFPPEAAIEACQCPASPGGPGAEEEWHTLVERTALKGDSHLYIEIDDDRVWTQLRLNIYPDGGVARLRVYGVAHYDWASRDPAEWVDLAAMDKGGLALDCNDMHFGHMSNLIAPGHAANMGDGWETRRRREPGNDWVILRLGHPGTIRRVEVDTAWFKGNYPAACALYGAAPGLLNEEEIPVEGDPWREILPLAPLGPDQLHLFDRLNDVGVVSHVRFDIHPDGGVSRLRLFGHHAASRTAAQPLSGRHPGSAGGAVRDGVV